MSFPFPFLKTSQKSWEREQSSAAVLLYHAMTHQHSCYRVQTPSHAATTRDTDTEIPQGCRQKEAFCYKPHPQRQLRKQKKGQQTLYSLAVMNNLFYFKVCIRCFLPKKAKVRNFHRTKRKRTSMILLQKQLK